MCKIEQWSTRWKRSCGNKWHCSAGARDPKEFLGLSLMCGGRIGWSGGNFEYSATRPESNICKKCDAALVALKAGQEAKTPGQEGEDKDNEH